MFFQRNKNKKKNQAKSSYDNLSRKRSNNKGWMNKKGILDNFNAYSLISKVSPDMAKDYNSMAGDIRNIKAGYKESKDLFKNNIGSISNLAKDSLKDSFATGNLSSKKRDQRAKRIVGATQGFDDEFLDSGDDDDGFGSGDFGLDNEDYDMDSLDFGTEDDESEASSSGYGEEKKNSLKVFKKNTIVNNSGLNEVQLATVSNTIVDGTTRLIKVNTMGFSKVSQSISYSASLSSDAYQKILTSFGTFSEELSKISENQVKQVTSSISKGSSLTDLLTGNFSLAGITKDISDNFEFANMLVPMLVSSLAEAAANPIGAAAKIGFKHLFTKLDKKSNYFGRANDYVRDLPLTMREYLESGALDSRGGKIGKFRNSKLGNKLFGVEGISKTLLNKLFGGDFLLNEIDTKNSLAKGSKVNFDAETHNSINIVIPGYLMKINQALSPKGEEVFYEYSSGKWREKSSSMKRLNEERIDYVENKNYRLRDFLTKEGKVNSENLSNAMGTIIDKKIKDLPTLEENKENFDQVTYENLKAAVEKNPKEFRKYTILNDIYRTFHSKNLTKVSGSEMNMYNEENIKNLHDKTGISSEIEFYKELASQISQLRSNINIYATSVAESSIKSDYAVANSQNIVESIISEVKNAKEDNRSISKSNLAISAVSSLANKSKVKSFDNKNNEEFIFNSSERQDALAMKAIDKNINEEDKKSPDITDKDLDSHGYNQAEQDYHDRMLSTLTEEGENTNNSFIGKLIELVSSFSGTFGIASSFLSGPVGKYLAKTALGKAAIGKFGKFTGMTKSTKLFKTLSNSKVGKNLVKGAKYYKNLPGGNMATKLLKNAPELTKNAKGLGSKVLGKLSGKKFSISGAKTLAKTGGKALSKAGSKIAGKLGSKGITLAAGKAGAKTLGKAGGKAIGKITGKIAGKIGIKALGKLSAAIPFIGPAIAIATSLPEIIQTLKHPIESLKHPFKTLGSFFGITEHPGITFEKNGGKNKNNLFGTKGRNKLLSPSEELSNIPMEGASLAMSSLGGKADSKDVIKDSSSEKVIFGGLEKTLKNNDTEGTYSILDKLFRKNQEEYSALSKDTLKLNLEANKDIMVKVLKTFFLMSPFGLFTGASKMFAKKTMNHEIVKNTIHNPKEAARSMFSNTAIGSLFELVTPSRTGTSWFKKSFDTLFDAFTLKKLQGKNIMIGREASSGGLNSGGLNGDGLNSDGLVGPVTGDTANGIKYFSQLEKPHSSTRYGGGTVKTWGCGPTSMAMIMSTYTGQNISPSEVAKWSQRNGHVGSGGSSWSLFNAYARVHGYRAVELGGNLSKALEYTKQGKLVVFRVSSFPPSGAHIMVLVGTTSDGRIMINDPASRKNTGKTWTKGDLAGRGAKYWAIVGGNGGGSAYTTDGRTPSADSVASEGNTVDPNSPNNLGSASSSGVSSGGGGGGMVSLDSILTTLDEPDPAGKYAFPVTKDYTEAIQKRVNEKYTKLFENTIAWKKEKERKEKEAKNGTAKPSTSTPSSSTPKTNTDIKKVVDKNKKEEEKNKAGNSGSTAAPSAEEIKQEEVKNLKDFRDDIKKDLQDAEIVKETIENIVEDQSTATISDGKDKITYNFIPDRIYNKINPTPGSSIKTRRIIEYDYEQYLILKDLLDVTENIDIDVVKIVDELDRITKTMEDSKSYMENNNDLRENSNILLNTIIDDTDKAVMRNKFPTNDSSNGLIKNIVPIKI